MTATISTKKLCEERIEATRRVSRNARRASNLNSSQTHRILSNPTDVVYDFNNFNALFSYTKLEIVANQLQGKRDRQK